jgi:hypothetical protein
MGLTTIRSIFWISLYYPQKVKLRERISQRICEKYERISWGSSGPMRYWFMEKKISCYSTFNKIVSVHLFRNSRINYKGSKVCQYCWVWRIKVFLVIRWGGVGIPRPRGSGDSTQVWSSCYSTRDPLGIPTVLLVISHVEIYMKITSFFPLYFFPDFIHIS